MRILSWNVLRQRGASPAEAAALIRAEAPDLLLLQEAGPAFAMLTDMVGGHYEGRRFEGGSDGLGAWCRERPDGTAWIPLERAPHGRKYRRPRTALVVALGATTAVNVHLSHGQALARRQARQAAEACDGHGAVVGDFNLIGPVGMRGWEDAGPRTWTHLGWGMAPLRLDRYLVRGLQGRHARAFAKGSSDHRPILVEVGR